MAEMLSGGTDRKRCEYCGSEIRYNPRKESPPRFCSIRCGRAYYATTAERIRMSGER